MSYKYLVVCVLSMLVFMSCGKKKTSVVQKSEEKVVFKPSLEFLWETDSLLTTCESVLYDELSGTIYVSNINDLPWEHDNNGFISKINDKGEILDLKWMEGLSGPKGMGILNEKLYVNDIDRVVEIDIKNQNIINTFLVESQPQLNDITIGNGIIYSSGSNSNTIYEIRNNTINEVAKDSLGRLNGLLHQDEGIYYTASASHNFGLYNADKSTFKTLVSDIGHGDGMVRLENGDFIVSSWKGQIFYINSNDWSKTLLLDTENQSIYAADIDYIPKAQILLIPTFFHNRVMAYKVFYE